MLDGIVDPEIARFVDYWQSKRQPGARFPARAALDPVDFRYVLGNVVLLEVSKAGDDPQRWVFRYRLIGTNIVARDGYDLTDKTLDELPEPEYRERIRQTCVHVCETGQPIHYIRELVLDQRFRCYEVAILPLASNGQDIDMLISVQREMQNVLENRARSGHTQ